MYIMTKIQMSCSYGPLAINSPFLSFKLLWSQVTTNSSIPSYKMFILWQHSPWSCTSPSLLVACSHVIKEWWKFVIFFALKASEILPFTSTISEKYVDVDISVINSIVFANSYWNLKFVHFQICKNYLLTKYKYKKEFFYFTYN